MPSNGATVRRELIRLAMRRQRAGSGSMLSFLLERTCETMWPDVSIILEGTQWAVVGAVATRLYMPERATLDLDVAVLATDNAGVRRRLAEAGWQFSGELSIGGSTWTSSDGSVVDVLELTQPWASEALEQAARNRDGQGLPVLPLPYLVLMKFDASRVQDIADITRMLGLASQSDLEAVRRLFARRSAEDQADLEALIQLGKLETGTA